MVLQNSDEAVERNIQHLVNEILERHEPVAYLGKCPIFVSKAVPKDQLICFSGSLIVSRVKFIGVNRTIGK